MDFTPIFQAKGDLLNKADIHVYQIIIERFNSMMKDNPEMYNNTKVLMRFFVKDSGQVMIRNYFYRNKKILVEMYRYMNSQGLSNDGMVKFVEDLTYEDVVSSIESDESYFRDLNEVINYIKTVGRFYGFTKEKDLLTIKSIVIISWVCRLSYVELVGIKRSDFNLDNHTLVYKGKEYSFSEHQKHFETLLDKLNETECEGFPSHKMTRYPVSDYLFKAAKGTNPTMSPNNVADTVKRFNKEASQYGKVISMPVLIKCSIFCELYELEKQSPMANLFTLIKRIDSSYKELSKAEAGGLLLLYNKWKELFS